jgi:hypothetical protein
MKLSLLIAAGLTVLLNILYLMEYYTALSMSACFLAGVSSHQIKDMLFNRT